MQYYVYRNDKIEGPWPARELIAQPGMDERTQVCTEENFAEWTDIGDIEELSLLLKLREANGALREKAQSAQEQVRTLEDEYENWARQLHQKIAEQNSLLEERLRKLDEAGGKLAAKDKETNIFKQRLTELKSQYLELKQFHDIQEDDHSKLRAHFQKKLSEQDDQLRASREELDAVRKAHDTREHELRERERRFAQNDWEMRHLEQQWQDLNKENKLLKDERSKLASELQRAQADAAQHKERADTGEQLAREAPLRAMKAETELQSLKETLRVREDDLSKLRAQAQETAERYEELRIAHRENLDKTAHLESQLTAARGQIQTIQQESVLERAKLIERENKFRQLAEEKDRSLDRLQSETRLIKLETQKAQEQTSLEQSERNKAESRWQAREEELREEIRRTERILLKHKDAQEELDQLYRESSRKLKAVLDKEAENAQMIEKLRRVLVRKESRIEILEAQVGERKITLASRAKGKQQIGGVLPAQKRLYPEADESLGDLGPVSGGGSGVHSRLQSFLLQRIEAKIDNIESSQARLKEEVTAVKEERLQESLRAEKYRFLKLFLLTLLSIVAYLAFAHGDRLAHFVTFF